MTKINFLPLHCCVEVEVVGAVYRPAVDVGVDNTILLGEIDVSIENFALVGNGLGYSAVFYSLLSLKVQLFTLLVTLFYIPALCGPKRLLKLQMTPL